MKKNIKLIALLALVLVSALMLTACRGFVVGSNYSGEIKAENNQIPDVSKEEKIEVPYEGPQPYEKVETDNPILAGLCDEEGRLTSDSNMLIDLEALGITPEEGATEEGAETETAEGENAAE